MSFYVFYFHICALSQFQLPTLMKKTHSAAEKFIRSVRSNCDNKQSKKRELSDCETALKFETQQKKR